MKNIENIGRYVGAAMLASFVIGMLSNFKLQTDLFAGSGLLVHAAAHPLQIGMITALGLLTGLLGLGVAALLSAHFRQQHPLLTTVYLSLAIIGLALSMLEYATLIAFRQLSEAFIATGAEAGSTFQASKALLAGLRNGIHYLDKFLGGLGVLTLFVFLFRTRLFPRAIAVSGMLAAVVQMIAVGHGLFGHNVPTALLGPLALAYVVTAGWLIVRGFRSHVVASEPARPV